MPDTFTPSSFPNAVGKIWGSHDISTALLSCKGFLLKCEKPCFSDATNNFILFVSSYMYCTARDRWGIGAQENTLLFMALWVRKV